MLFCKGGVGTASSELPDIQTAGDCPDDTYLPIVALSELHPLVTIIIDSCVVAPIISSVQVYHLFCGTKSQLTNESNIG